MGTNVLDKVRKLKASRPQSGNNSRLRGYFHNWNDGDNILRLVGEFVEVRTHFIAPAPKRNDRGLCMPTAFQGDDKLPMKINCLDWDIGLEEFRKVKVCPVCKMWQIAKAVLKDNPTPEEKAFFDKLRMDCSPKSELKWNILDRDDPYIIFVDESGTEKRVIGYKIASVGMEAWGDIEGIFDQCGFDITDIDKGVDIKVHRGSNGTRTTYTAQAVVEGTSLRVTPLTEEERALELHDLKSRCGKQVEADKIISALHDDLRSVLEANETSEAVEEAPAAEAEAEAEVEAPAPAPVAKPVPVAAPAPRPAAPVAKAPVAAPAPRPAAPVAAPRPAAPVAKAPAAPVRAPVRPAAVPAKPAAAAPVAQRAPAPRVPARPAAKPVPAPAAAEVDAAIEEGGDGLMDDGAKKA